MHGRQLLSLSLKKLTHIKFKHMLLKVGWENEVKWRFFAPVLAAASLALLIMLIVLCNLATPAIR